MMNNYETDQVQKEKAMKKKKFGTVKLLAGALVIGMLAGVAFEGGQYAVKEFTKTDSVSNLLEEEDTVDATSTSATATSSADVSSVVENVMPSIVAVDTTVTETISYFGQNYSEESKGSGSGIIIGENNGQLLIATNNHVIEGEDASVTITFADESTAKATVKGADTSSDLAVLAVDKSSLSEETKKSIKVATLGDSESVKVGDMAIAIGNALGYGQSVTVGYVSAKDREVAMEDGSMTLLQTDAAINPGNSGGALLNVAGEVIGINSAKYASEEVEGMGYAIPISAAVPIINELMNREQLDVSEQGYLGIKGQDVSEEMAKLYNMPQGIYVGEITDGSPAEKGGMLVGDIITAINGKSIVSLSELQEVLTYTKAGKVVTVTVQELSDGEYKEKNLEITLGSKSDAPKTSSGKKQSSSQKDTGNKLPGNR